MKRAKPVDKTGFINYNETMPKKSFNTCTITGNIATITLTDHHDKTTGVALLDTKELSRVSGTSFWLSKGRYARSSRGSLHQIITRARGKHVDHINGDGLDNRKSNLRITSNAQNAWNSIRPRSTNVTGYKGVCYDKRYNQYYAMICKHGVRKYLGTYRTPEKAHEVYKTKHKELFGEYSPY